jgi:very-short-patch-repair endonuclease
MDAVGEHEEDDLAALAARQHGIVSARQLATLGYSRSAVARAASARRLHRIHRGVYAVGHTNLNWHSHCLAAVLACTPAVASHSSAGWLWGLLRYKPARIDVTAPTRRHRRLEIFLHRASLDERDVDELEGIPVTSLARTQLDLAATLSPPRLDRLLERSEELKLFDLAAIDELLGRVTHHPGLRPLRAALAVYRDDPAFTRSALERRFLKLVLDAGLPRPAMNFDVAGYELDAYWEPERFAVELDVYETHGTRQAFERDRFRHEDLKLIGVEMIRVTGPRLDRESDALIRRVERLLAQRRRQLPFAVCRA